MFSGIVEETGTVKNARRVRNSVHFSIAAKKTLHGLHADGSISVDGVCLTVLGRSKSDFRVQAVEETLKKTNLGMLKSGSKVNLERPLQMSDRIDGHFVLGHVDTVGTVRREETKKSSKVLWIRYPKRFRQYLIPVGSIAVNGVSLTVSGVNAGEFAVSLIPHTMQVTTLGILKKGSIVNLEFDMLGKYIVHSYKTIRR
ncbi:MAG: riboflavin synthase [Ignavibacteriales bacterium]|nr:riboflavin synthase [Ignavibacteriales bacterium]